MQTEPCLELGICDREPPSYPEDLCGDVKGRETGRSVLL
jgi:hypothetical protein